VYIPHGLVDILSVDFLLCEGHFVAQPSEKILVEAQVVENAMPLMPLPDLPPVDLRLR